MDRIPQFAESPSLLISINTIFRSLMLPLYLHEWAFDWAFHNVDLSAIHQDRVLPVRLFQNAIFFTVVTRFQETYVSTTVRNRHERLVGALPVCRKDNISVGYITSFGFVRAEYANCSYIQSDSEIPHIGRFVMDHTHNSLIMIFSYTKHKFLTIKTYSLLGTEHYTFTLPLKKYIWKHLSHICPFITIQGRAIHMNSENNAFKSSSEYERRKNVLLNSRSLNPTDSHELWGKVVSSLCVMGMQLSNENIACVNTGLQLQPQLDDGNNLSSIENLPLISGQDQFLCEIDLINMFQNRKFIPEARIDIDPTVSSFFTTYDVLLKIPNLHHTSHLSAREIRQSMQQKIAYLYYSKVLSVTTDRPLMGVEVQPPLLEPQKQSGTKSILNTEDKGSKLKTREQLLEERRRRNIESAKRSNAKKKQAIMQMEEDLKACKVQLEQLQERHLSISEKNKALRELVFSRFYNL